jgi:hypothetical protein
MYLSAIVRSEKRERASMIIGSRKQTKLGSNRVKLVDGADFVAVAGAGAVTSTVTLLVQKHDYLVNHK